MISIKEQTNICPDMTLPLNQKEEIQKNMPGAIPASTLDLLRVTAQALKTEIALFPFRSTLYLTGLSITLVIIFLFIPEPVIAPTLAVLVSLIVGVLFTTRALVSLLSRGIELLDQQSQEEQETHGLITTTGLPQLDLLLSEHYQHILTLHKKVDELNSERNMLIHRYEVLTESLVAAIIIRDTSGKILFCSPYAEVLTGYSLYEIYSKEEDFFYSIIHPDDREKYTRAQKISKYGEAFQFRYRFFHKTGIEMWAETRTVPILDEHGVITSSLSITLDVTATIRHQKQVEEKNRDLEDFSYMISHDLKAPIFTIKGMVNLIAEEYQEQLSHDLKEPFEHISNANQRLEKLVAAVLEYSRISTQENKLEEIDLATALDEVHQDFAAQLESAGGNLEVQGELPVIIGDNLKIYQILSNLIGNAIKYRAENRSLQILISQQPSRNERYVTLSIKDNGLGIPENKQGEIFRPFQRAHDKEIEGSGIGLACVKKLLEKLNGDISVKATEGVGSEFLVSFNKASANLLSNPS